MSATSEDLLMKGQLQGRIAGITRKDWSLFYLEVSTSQLRIFEGHEDPNVPRKHLRSLEISSGDNISADKDKKTFKFTLKRADGTYTFKGGNEHMRQKWIAALKTLIHEQHMPGSIAPIEEDAFGQSVVGRQRDGPKRVDLPKVPPAAHKSSTLPSSSRSKVSQSAINQPLPRVPGVTVIPGSGGDSGSNSPNDSGSGSFSGNVRFSKMSMRSDDSGLGVSDNGQVFRQTHSGEETHRRPPVKTKQTSSSDSAQFEVREELDNYKWFWGDMNRVDSEAKMKEVGVVGNFAIRINATGHFVMTFWRSDGIHHHRIIHQLGIYRFEKTAVQAEGKSLVDLLDDYMKKCIDKKIVPIGGVLHLVYEEPWNPPDIDMDQLQEKLSAQKKRRDRQKVLAEALKQPQQFQNPRKKGDKPKKEAYTMVSPSSEAKEDEFTQSMPASSSQQCSKDRKLRINGKDHKEKVPPPTPLKPTGEVKDGNQKPLPLPPTASKPSSTAQAAERNKSPAFDKRHNPLPPTPDGAQPTENARPTKQRHVPTPSPRTNKTISPTSPQPLTPEPPGAPTTSATNVSPPPQEQAIYMNSNFTGRQRRVKKSPVPSPAPKPCSPGNSDPDPGGQEAYQNTGFGDDSENQETMYANVPQRRKNGHAHQPHKAYQNVGYYSSTDAGGTAYQNVQFSGRAHQQMH